jgi:hypothetical protein
LSSFSTTRHQQAKVDYKQGKNMASKETSSGEQAPVNTCYFRVVGDDLSSPTAVLELERELLKRFKPNKFIGLKKGAEDLSFWLCTLDGDKEAPVGAKLYFEVPKRLDKVIDVYIKEGFGDEAWDKPFAWFFEKHNNIRLVNLTIYAVNAMMKGL